jgi:hypothetical protein
MSQLLIEHAMSSTSSETGSRRALMSRACTAKKRALLTWLTVLAGAFAVILPVCAGNLVPNSSFECGSGRGWQMWSEKDNAGSPLSLKNQVANIGWHGNKSVKLPSAYLHSRPIWLQAGTTYTFSFYVRADNPDSFRYEICSIDTVNNGTGAWVVPTSSWTRFTSTFTPTTSYWYMVGWFHYQPSMIAYIDGVQLEVGATATPYAPMAVQEAALEESAAYNTVFKDDPKEVQVKWWNDGPAATNSVYYEVFDLWNRRQSSGFATSILPARSGTTLSIPLPLIGWQRVVTRIVNVNDSRDELTIAVLPRSPESGQRPEGMIGAHSNWDTNQIRFLRAAGHTWTRSLSPSINLFRWRIVEPSRDNFVWNDAGVQAFAGNGLSALGTLADVDGEFPPWAVRPDGSIDMRDYSNYVWRVVNRYKGNVHYWEIWNEPAQSGPLWLRASANYAAMLTVGAAAVKAADPAGRVVGFGGVFDEIWATQVWNLISPTTRDSIDVISCHLYPNDNSTDPNDPELDGRFSRWQQAFGAIKPIWNTETGTWGRGGMFTENVIWNYQTEGTVADEYLRAEQMIRSKLSVERTVRNVIRSLGYGFQKYFYYDHRHWTAEMMGPTHCTAWEYTDSLRPVGVGVSVASVFLDQCSSARRISNPAASALEMYLFRVGASNVVAAFNGDRVNRQLIITNDSFVVYDVMGNPLTFSPGKLTITRTPQYIVSSALSADQLEQTLTTAAVTVIPDTSSPNLSIDIAPTGVWNGGVALLKWTGIDDTYVNSAKYKTNITFAWKLDNDPYPAFSQTNFVRANIAAGGHALWVKAKDRDGNVSEASYIFAPSPSARAVVSNLRVVGAP